MKEKNLRGLAGSQTGKMVIFIAAVLLLFVILNIFAGGRFLTANNLLAVLSNSVVTAFVVLAMCFIFTMGITDLSLGAIMVLAGNMGGVLALEAGLGYPGMFLGAMAVCIGCLMFNVLLIRKAGVPAWILGLGMTMVYEAIGAIYSNAMIASGGQTVSLQNSYRELGSIPVNIILLLIAAAIAYFLYNRTSIGFNLRAVGSNEAVAKVMGVKVDKAVFLAVLVGGCFLGVGCAINISYQGRITPSTGLNSISAVFNPLAAFLLAKTLSGIFNITVASVIGAFTLTALFNVLTILGVPSGTWQQVALGAVVLLCGMLAQRGFKGVVK